MSVPTLTPLRKLVSSIASFSGMLMLAVMEECRMAQDKTKSSDDPLLQDTLL